MADQPRQRAQMMPVRRVTDFHKRNYACCRMFWMAAAWVSLAVLPAVAQQVQRFDNPIGIGYGDPKTRAPMKTSAAVCDWNRDGELDLLANGWWWKPIDNVSGDEPVYQRGGRARAKSPFGDLDGDHQLDVVQVRKGHFVWFEDETESGERNFVERGKLPFVLGGPLKIPDSKGITDVFDNWSVVALADLDNDGRTDLLMKRFHEEKLDGDDGYAPWSFTDFDTGWIDGQWIFNSFDTSFWWHRNVGTSSEPAFTLASLISVGSSDTGLVFPWRTVSATPIDWNNDGKTDIFVQVFDHAIVFLNIGQASNGRPLFNSGNRLRFGASDNIAHRKEGVPYRDAEGRLHILFHGGAVAYEAVQIDVSDPLQFSSPRWVLFENPTSSKLDIFSVPDAADWDGDGRLDLIVGSEVGFIWWLRNLNENGGVKHWDVPRMLEVDGEPIRLDRHENLQGPEEYLIGYTNPTAEDWDLDGDLDLIVGCHGETYYYFDNVGSKTSPRLAARGPLLCGKPAKPVVCAWRSRPGVGDLNGDGLPDLVGVDEHRQLCVWLRQRAGDGALTLGERENPIDAEGYPFILCRPSRGIGRSKYVVIDWDGDGKQDIISSSPLGDRDSFIYFYRNVGERDGKLALEFHPRMIEVKGHVAKNHFTHFNMIEPVDFNGDGEWEGLAGMDLRHPSIGWTWVFYFPKMETAAAGETIERPADGAVGWPTETARATMNPAPKQGDIYELREGELVFRNRPWVIKELPEQLRGKRYLRGDIELGFTICEQPGVVYVLAPAFDGTRRDAYCEYFQSTGFQKCSNEPVQLFGDDERGKVTVLWKHVEPGDKVVFGKWAIVAF